MGPFCGGVPGFGAAWAGVTGLGLAAGATGGGGLDVAGVAAVAGFEVFVPAAGVAVVAAATGDFL